jgi:hypothetical protein
MNRVEALMPNRREDVRVIARLWDELSETLGCETAEKLLCEAISAENAATGRRAARAAFAAEGQTSLEHFIKAFRARKNDGGLAMADAAIIGDELTLTVMRCDYPTLYHNSKLPTALADLLSCGGEKAFARGYDHRLELVEYVPTDNRCTSCRLIYRWNHGALPPTEPADENRLKLKLR